MLPDLKIGTIFAIFNLSGTVPVMKDWFIMWARGFEILLIVLRIILVEMLSNPVLLFFFNVLAIVITSDGSVGLMKKCIGWCPMSMEIVVICNVR